MTRPRIAIVLIGVIAVMAVFGVLQEPVAAASPHQHATLHHATIRIGVRHLDIAADAGIACREPQAPVVFGHCDRRGSASSHASCDPVTPLRI